MAFFGDHRQLPPVCESDQNDSISTAYWAKSALHIENAWSRPLDFDTIAKSSPIRQRLSVIQLKQTYRFDDSLATILRNRVYKHSNIFGNSSDPTAIYICDVTQTLDLQHKRVNIAEVNAICMLLKSLEVSESESVVILTAYKNQATAIRKALRRQRLLYKAEVLNTHRAQGREWDVVIFSTVDGGQHPGPYFTDSNNSDGVLVLNTTLSRVKRKLFLVADCSYWRGRDQLIGDLIEIAEPIDI